MNRAVPNFKTEQEEADWWDAHQEEVASEFERAALDGTLARGTIARRGAIPTTTIRLDANDIALARSQAQRRGLRYQTYLKMLIHEALLRDEERRAG